MLSARTRLLSTMIYGVTALDPLTYISVGLLLLIVVVAASYVPALRASRRIRSRSCGILSSTSFLSRRSGSRARLPDLCGALDLLAN